MSSFDNSHHLTALITKAGSTQLNIGFTLQTLLTPYVLTAARKHNTDGQLSLTGTVDHCRKLCKMEAHNETRRFNKYF